MHEQLQAIITVLSLINPAICAAMFSRAVAGQSLGEKITDSARAAFAVLIILTVAALLGKQLLNLFGVSLDAFMVAGGVGVDGVLHAQGATGRGGFKTKAIAYAADSLCRQPRDHYGSHHALRCTHPDDIADHRADRYCGGDRDYLAGDVARRSLRGQTGR
jgi:hypothetical protein